MPGFSNFPPQLIIFSLTCDYYANQKKMFEVPNFIFLTLFQDLDMWKNKMYGIKEDIFPFSCPFLHKSVSYDNMLGGKEVSICV